MTLYVSFEQEEALLDYENFNLPGPSPDTFHHGYVTISDVPWGREGPDWKPTLIGPIHDDCADFAVIQAVSMLVKLGNKVVTNDTAKGEWNMDCYTPTADELG